MKHNSLQKCLNITGMENTCNTGGPFEFFWRPTNLLKTNSVYAPIDWKIQPLRRYWIMQNQLPDCWTMVRITAYFHVGRMWLKNLLRRAGCVTIPLLWWMNYTLSEDRELRGRVPHLKHTHTHKGYYIRQIASHVWFSTLLSLHQTCGFPHSFFLYKKSEWYGTINLMAINLKLVFLHMYSTVGR